VSFGRSGPRRIVSQVRAEASSLALCRTPETMAIANPRWSERSEWNLGYESQRIIAHRRCRLTPTREKKHRGRWDASSKLPGHYASPPHVCCAARGAPTRAASLMLTCINCYRLSELFARLIHVRKHLHSSVDLFLSDSNILIHTLLPISFDVVLFRLFGLDLLEELIERVGGRLRFCRMPGFHIGKLFHKAGG
jgi:hypothetical protein